MNCNKSIMGSESSSLSLLVPQNSRIVDGISVGKCLRKELDKSTYALAV